MDPASLAIGVAGILPLITKAICSAKAYIDAVGRAREAAAALITVLEALQLNISNLHALLKSTSLCKDDLRFHQTSVLLSCSTACEAKLRALCRKLSNQDNGRIGVCLWPFSEKEHQKTLQELQTFTNWMQFALSIDGCRLLSRTADDVLELMGRQLGQFKLLQSVEENTSVTLNIVQAQNKLFQDAEERSKILGWLSTPRHYMYQKHQALQSSRTRDTGNWILRHDLYLKWRDGSEDSNVLWCHGIQGSGKSTLSSIIIDNLLESASNHALPIAFFYFDYQDQSTQTPTTVLPSILRHLLENIDHIPPSVSSAYETLQPRGKPPVYECERLIGEIAKAVGPTYIIIDALDECSSEHRTTFLRSLDNLSHTHGLRLLVTSRPHFSDITHTFRRHPQIKIEAQEEDIRTYLRHELVRRDISSMADGDFVERLVQRLTEGADGMFFLPVLQLRTILKEATIGEMEDRLDNMSRGLDEAFAETISRIQSLPESRRRIGMGVLMYLAHARRPMTVSQLSDVLAMRPGQRTINVKYRPSAKVLLECCQGLVTIDPETQNARVAHYAVQEYLVAHSASLFPRAGANLAIQCLRYLLLDSFAHGPWATRAEIESLIEAYPFLPYAVSFWGSYAAGCETDPEVWSALFDFFSSAAATAVANQIRQLWKGYRWEYWNSKESRSFTPLHLAARYGLLRAASTLSDGSLYGVNAKTEMGATPVIQAAAGGHIAVLRMLMQRGADPYVCNWYGNALHCAIEAGQTNTVRELIMNWGMDPNEKFEGFMPYLDCTLAHDAADTFEALVDLGLDLTPYMKFVSDGDKGVDEDASPSSHLPRICDIHGNIFLKACVWGCANIVERMINRGWADVNMRSEMGLTPLHWAAAHVFDPAVLGKLIAAGADIDALDNRGLLPIAYALRARQTAAAEFLIAAGYGEK
ncbi:Vegetative incompatibility protein HET-E-1 [Madurella mycetomatis]|uniref:Vegetative incompatibility protein HET-E-1 n=1 Tax=Madurella mycetomatis TaxID=100816 RepID=A0A175VQ98_9PEZI|nr:Vegetative incompatibility protein HET-E-1 [Madurella mycetomatis]